MKTRNLFFKTAILIATVTMVGCNNDDAVQGDKKNGKILTAAKVTFTGENVQPTRTNSPASRTFLTHAIGKGATPYWSTGDKIWAKDNYGRWTESTAGTLNQKKTHGVFSISGAFKNGCEIHYTGANTKSGTEVTIASSQAQASPNDFSHAGESGDCGSAIASGNENFLKFRLNHKASYLCFQPRTSNKYVKNSKLFKIEVISEDNIAGTYDFANGSLAPSPKFSPSKKITLTLGHNDGFSVTNSQADLSVNGAYIVIAPGQHTLTIRYWLRNKADIPYGPYGGAALEGTVTKTVNINCEAGMIYDITANLDPKDYSSKYYMWDAQIGQDYWKGYENEQPTLDKQRGIHYPYSLNDSRWYNRKSFSAGGAERSCKNCPNVNEISWYIKQGDPHWDNEELWTLMGHIYVGGMWFKKKENISGYSSSRSSDGTDYTTVDQSCSILNHNVPKGLPNRIKDYFYLPALGGYDSGVFSGAGNYGAYWTSTPTPMNGQPTVPTRGAYYLYIYPTTGTQWCNADVYGGENRYKGFQLWTAE